MIGLWRLLAHFMGLDDGTGPFYLFWSGFGANLGELTIVLGLLSFYWKHTCHERRCWRIGRHPVEGTPYVVCRRHHPRGAPTAEHILQRHRAQGSQEEG